MSGEPAGGRLARREARRRRRRRAALIGVVGAGIVAVVALAAGGALRGGQGASDGPDPERASAPPARQRTLLLVRAPHEEGAAKGATLFVAGPEPGRGAILLLPVGTLMDVPGHGLDRLGAAYHYGGGALVQAAVENTLGVGIDHTATVSDAGLAAFLGRLGTVEVEVARRLVARGPDGGEPSLRFAPGAQHLDGPRLVEYLSFRDQPSDELSSFPRQERVWRAVLGTLSGSEGGDRLEALLDGGAPQLDGTFGEAWLRELLEDLAAAAARDELAVALLPVEPFGGEGPDGGATYRLQRDEAQALLQELLPAAAGGEDAEPLRVEVLNGVGTPGIGQAVHRRLQGAGFRIVRTDNASSFDFGETRILVYDEAHLEAARRLRARLGVGTISVSRRPQSVVDLTVVVGADFAQEEGREP